jgi:glutathione synthase/RimK-type ligase-like ATP-grasp enzyme
MSPHDCCVLNQGGGAWAFEPLAKRLSIELGIEVATTPKRFNYLLNYEEPATDFDLFIPLESIRLAADKRLLAAAFKENNVPTPRTILCDTFEEVLSFQHENPDKEWCLKFPTSCGANGHRLLAKDGEEPVNWPRPFVVQEFVRMERPEVYRTYCAGGELFGWVARRYPEGTRSSPWVAHARGARYVILDEPPKEAKISASLALRAADLWNSFGCVDMLQRPTGEWLVMEVGTDGLFNHVDRDLNDPDFEREIYRRIKGAFWKAAGVSGE